MQISGAFLGTNEGLPADHTAALLALFGVGAVTAQMQTDRLRYYAEVLGGSFNLYVRNRSYSAATAGAVNMPAGTYPRVVIKNIRETIKPGVSRIETICSFVVGIRNP